VKDEGTDYQDVGGPQGCEVASKYALGNTSASAPRDTFFSLVHACISLNVSPSVWTPIRPSVWTESLSRI